jgi:hypothetical protein
MALICATDQVDLKSILADYQSKKAMRQSLQALPCLQAASTPEPVFQLLTSSLLWSVFQQVFPDKVHLSDWDKIRSAIGEPSQINPIELPSLEFPLIVQQWGGGNWGVGWRHEIDVIHLGKTKLPFQWAIDNFVCNFFWCINYYFPVALSRLLQMIHHHVKATAPTTWTAKQEGCITRVIGELRHGRVMRMPITYVRYTKQESPSRDYIECVSNVLRSMIVLMNVRPDHAMLMLTVHAVQNEVTPKLFRIDAQYHAFFRELEERLRLIPQPTWDAMVQSMRSQLLARARLITPTFMVRPWEYDRQLLTQPCIRKANHPCDRDPLLDEQLFRGDLVAFTGRLNTRPLVIDTNEKSLDLRLPVNALVDKKSDKPCSLYYILKNNFSLAYLIDCQSLDSIVSRVTEIHQRVCQQTLAVNTVKPKNRAKSTAAAASAKQSSTRKRNRKVAQPSKRPSKRPRKQQLLTDSITASRLQASQLHILTTVPPTAPPPHDVSLPPAKLDITIEQLEQFQQFSRAPSDWNPAIDTDPFASMDPFPCPSPDHSNSGINWNTTDTGGSLSPLGFDDSGADYNWIDDHLVGNNQRSDNMDAVPSVHPLPAQPTSLPMGSIDHTLWDSDFTPLLTLTSSTNEQESHAGITQIGSVAGPFDLPPCPPPSYQLNYEPNFQLGSQIGRGEQRYSTFDSKFDSNFSFQYNSQSDPQVGLQVGEQVCSKLDSKFSFQFDSQPGPQLDSQPGPQPDPQLGTHPGSRLDSRPNAQLDHPVGYQPTSQPTYQPTSQSTPPPTIAGDTNLGSGSTIQMNSTTHTSYRYSDSELIITHCKTNLLQLKQSCTNMDELPQRLRNYFPSRNIDDLIRFLTACA